MLNVVMPIVVMLNVVALLYVQRIIGAGNHFNNSETGA
jgi:hypothetical protein